VFARVMTELSHFGNTRSLIQQEIEDSIHSIDVNNKDTFTSLSAADSALVDQIIDKHLRSIADMQKVAEMAAKEIRTRRQWALAYTANLRDSQGYNKHSFQSILDWGMTPRLNWTNNIGIDIFDAKTFGSNRNGGSASTELQFRITEDPKVVQPILFSLSGYGQWLTNVAPTYKVQGKLSIPLGQKTGMSLPISVTYASRTDLIQEAHTEAKFGFTFDAGKIASALLPYK